ncbi:hypothetical protein Sjap_025397 [Stephania japonica]|uniref:Uncharacterized protein n=1 Tax=Stephania japonica TaxID=461633 RepID=A0AAP0E1Q9_9MAGN
MLYIEKNCESKSARALSKLLTIGVYIFFQTPTRSLGLSLEGINFIILILL